MNKCHTASPVTHRHWLHLAQCLQSATCQHRHTTWYEQMSHIIPGYTQALITPCTVLAICHLSIQAHNVIWSNVTQHPQLHTGTDYTLHSACNLPPVNTGTQRDMNKITSPNVTECTEPHATICINVTQQTDSWDCTNACRAIDSGIQIPRIMDHLVIPKL